MGAEKLSASKGPKVLAIASAGGHWEQLRRVRPAWENCTVTYVTTSTSRKKELEDEARESGGKLPDFHVVVEASRWQKFTLLRQFFQIIKIVSTTRPDVVISTGAAPGFFALMVGKLFRARTVWLDSIANVGELSLSGKKVKPYADLWLTQWEHLAENHNRGKRLRFEGKVL